MFKVKKGDYLINDNGDVWFVERVHRDGAVSIYNGAGTGEDELTYSAGEIQHFFRKLPAGDYSDVDYLDPKPYWYPSEPKPKTTKTKRKATKTTKRRSPSHSTVSMRGVRS